MLQWNDGSWEHRAYWGANTISYGSDGTASRHYMGPLPAAGQWARLGWRSRVKQPVKRFVPIWALQFVAGIFVVLIAVGVAVALLGPVLRGPTAFFDELGKTISRIAPQPQADLRGDEQIKAVIKAMPNGKLRVGTILDDQNRVVFTITADRSAVKAAVQPGDELRIARDGSVEIVPTGIPGVIDSLQRAIEDLKRKFFGP